VVLRAGLHDPLQELIFVDGSLNFQDALSIELPRHRAGLCDCSPVPAKEVLDLGAGAVAIVAQGLDDDRDPTRPVALVTDGLVTNTLELTRAAFDGPFDRVDGHC